MVCICSKNYMIYSFPSNMCSQNRTETWKPKKKTYNNILGCPAWLYVGTCYGTVPKPHLWIFSCVNWNWMFHHYSLRKNVFYQVLLQIAGQISSLASHTEIPHKCLDSNSPLEENKQFLPCGEAWLVLFYSLLQAQKEESLFWAKKKGSVNGCSDQYNHQMATKKHHKSPTSQSNDKLC